MDPFNIAAAVIGLSQGLLELVSKNRQKIKQLATDSYQTVADIQVFYAKHINILVEDRDLQKLVADLHTSLAGIVKKCKKMVPRTNGRESRKRMGGFWAWLKRDELESCLKDLNIRAQQCQIKFMTLATLKLNATAHEIRATTARIETSMSSIHQHVVVRRVSKNCTCHEDSQPPHVDLAGRDRVPNSVEILKCPDPPLHDDVIKHAYLRLQVKDIDTHLAKLLRDPNMSFHIPPLQHDDSTHAGTHSQLYISWEIVQHHTALESAKLIDAIHNAGSSTSVDDVGTALTHLGYRYAHLDMHHEALKLSALAIQLDRLAIEVHPDSDRLQRHLAIDLENYAGLLLECGKSTVEATRCMVEAVSIKRHLVAKLPLPDRKVSLAHCLSKSSSLARRTGDLETAESHSVEALEIILDVMGTPPGTIPDANTLRSMVQGWAAADRNGVLILDGWRDQVVLTCASILKQRFRSALARKRFSDAYKYATASRNVYRIISNRHPHSHLITLRDITTELLKEWADPLRSGTDTTTLYTEAISYVSAIPSQQGHSDRDGLFRKYTLQAKLSIHLHRTGNPLGAVEAQRTASLYWDHYYSTYPDMAQKQMSSLVKVQDAIRTLHGQVQLYYTGHLPQLPATNPLAVDSRQASTAPISKRPTLGISDHTYQSIRQQAKTMEQWFLDARRAELAPKLGGPKTRESLTYVHFDAVMACCFALLGESDAAHQAARHAIDASGRVVPQVPLPPSTKNGEKTRWTVLGWVLNIAVWVSEACLTTPNDTRSLPCIQDVVALVKSLFPSPEPVCVPAGVDREHILTVIGSILAFYCRHLETLRRMDECLSTSKSNLVWYIARAPFSHPTNRDHRHIAFALDVARNLVYAGQWSTALTYTTAITNVLVSGENLPLATLEIGRSKNICWWTCALLTHCSILLELGRVEVAARCISQGVETLKTASGDDRNMWKGPGLVRKARISSLLQDIAGQMEHLGNCKLPDLRASYTAELGYYFIAPSPIHSGFHLDASCIFADIGDHKQAIVHAQKALSSITILTTDIFKQWQDFAFIQQRTDSVIALAVAFILGGHIQDAANLFPPLFDIYKKELQFQRNLYPGYAVALRLAEWVFNKVGNVVEGKKMKKRQDCLGCLFVEEEDEETSRVIQIRLEIEEGRPAIQRVREILGVEPYQPELVA